MAHAVCFITCCTQCTTHTPHTEVAVPMVLDALSRVVPWVSQGTAQQGRLGMLTTLLHLLSSEDEGQVTIAAWVLWVLCAKVGGVFMYIQHICTPPPLPKQQQGDARRRMVKAGGIQHMLRLMSTTSNDTLRVAAARVLRSLALVDRMVPLLDSCGAVASLALLLRTGSPVVQLAACCALSNVANSPRAGTINQRVLCDPLVLHGLKQMLTSDSLQARRTAAVLVKVLCGQQDTTVVLLQQGVLAACVWLLKQHAHEFYVGVVTALLEHAARHCDGEQLMMLGSGAVEALALLLNSPVAAAVGNVRLDALRALQGFLGRTTVVSCFLSNACVVPAVWELMGSATGVRLRHQCAVLLLEVCTQYKSCVVSGKGGIPRVAEELDNAQQLTPRTLGIAPLLGEDDDEQHAPLVIDDPAQVRWLMKLLAVQDTSSQCVAAALLKHLAGRPCNRPMIDKAGAVHVLQEVLTAATSRRRWFVASEAAAALELMASTGVL